eukprot:scaffold280453_cov31-Tisochrysis_lutea.AAC.4
MGVASSGGARVPRQLLLNNLSRMTYQKTNEHRDARFHDIRPSAWDGSWTLSLPPLTREQQGRCAIVSPLVDVGLRIE